MKTSFKTEDKTLFQTVNNVTCTQKVFTERKWFQKETVIYTMELRPEMENM